MSDMNQAEALTKISIEFAGSLENVGLFYALVHVVENELLQQYAVNHPGEELPSPTMIGEEWNSAFTKKDWEWASSVKGGSFDDIPKWKYYFDVESQVPITFSANGDIIKDSEKVSRFHRKLEDAIHYIREVIYVYDSPNNLTFKAYNDSTAIFDRIKIFEGVWKRIGLLLLTLGQIEMIKFTPLVIKKCYEEIKNVIIFPRTSRQINRRAYRICVGRERRILDTFHKIPDIARLADPLGEEAEVACGGSGHNRHGRAFKVVVVVPTAEIVARPRRRNCRRERHANALLVIRRHEILNKRPVLFAVFDIRKDAGFWRRRNLFD